jgi:hypothetical protein
MQLIVLVVVVVLAVWALGSLIAEALGGLVHRDR